MMDSGPDGFWTDGQDGSGPGPAHPNCLPIEIPADDDFFRQHGQRCMNFVRTLAGVSYDCKLGPRRTFNEISSFIDAGTVYSNDPHVVEKLRSFKAGQLKVRASSFIRSRSFIRCCGTCS